MAETSRSQVTITLGRSGQVVKRAGHVLDREFSDPVPAVGSKRSVRDRLGSSADMQLDNKRLRGDNGRLSSQGSNFLNGNTLIHNLSIPFNQNSNTSSNSTNLFQDFHLNKDDLRFKIMKKTQTNGHHHNTMDLRDMLSRRARSSTTNSITPPHSLHDPRHETQSQSQSQSQRAPDSRRIPEPQRMPDPRNERQGMIDPRDKRQHMSQPQDERERQRVPQTRDGSRQGIPKMNGGYTSMRTPEAPSSQMGFLGNSYSSAWTLDHIRRKSPERGLNSSRGLTLSPPRRIEDPQRRMISREYENPRTVVYPSRESGEISRPMGMTTSPFLTKPPLSAGPVKSLGPLPPPSLPPGSNMQRSQYPVQEHVTVEGFLRSLGLEKYVISFKVEEVDMAALSQMGDHDLKELGIPMGPRKKILLALIARTRRQAR